VSPFTDAADGNQKFENNKGKRALVLQIESTGISLDVPKKLFIIAFFAHSSLQFYPSFPICGHQGHL